MMKEGVAKLFSMTLCAIIIADISALASVDMQMDESPSPLSGSPTMIWVDDDFADDPPNHKWNSVQEGVDDANNGDTVYVFNGSYNEHVLIETTVNLMGEDWKTTIIDGGGVDGDVIWIKEDWVNVSGFTITNGGDRYSPQYDAGITVSTYHNRIWGNNISENLYAGITLGGKYNTVSGNNILSNSHGIHIFGKYNTISDNNITRNSRYGIDTHWNVEGNTILGNTISFNGYDGSYAGIILRYLTSYNMITENIISSNWGNGILLGNSEHNTILNNTVSNNWDGGVWLTDSAAHNALLGNDIVSNQGGLIMSFRSNNNTVSGNNISSNQNGGIDISYWSRDNMVHDNNVESNGWNGIIVGEGSVSNTIYHNNIIDHTLQAEDPDPSNNSWHHPILLEGNYWSDYTGMDDGSGIGKHAIAGDGIGDTLIPHPGIDYDFYPFMNENGWVVPLNVAPVADAGPDQTVHVGDVVQFDGSGSYDPDAGWNSITVDSRVGAGVHSSLVLDSGDRPHIGYFDQVNHDLRYAKWTGSIWIVGLVDSLGDVGEYTSMALDTNDFPHVSYYDATNRDLKYARLTGTDWLIETVDSWGDVGAVSSIALDDEDRPHISYLNATRPWSYELKYAEWTGSEWNMTTVESEGSGVSTSLALDIDGNPHISYYNRWYGDLKYAKWTGSNWSIETVDSYGFVGIYTSIILDANDNPHISYYDGSNRDLKYVKWTGAGWGIETVDSAGDVGLFPSIALDSNDNPHISYRDMANLPFHSNGSLKYAKWDGTAWILEPVDNDGWGSTSLALDTHDVPHISYFNWTEYNLRYAKKEGGIVSYDWDFGDGSPHGSGVKPTHVYSSPGVYNVTLAVTDAKGATDTDNCVVTVLPKNQPPVGDADGPYSASEGSLITLDATGSYDPDGDALQYRWDLDGDGIWDTGWSSSPYFVQTWGDDYSGEVVLEVWDGELSDTDTATITVFNVAPTAELRILPIDVNVSVRIAGEKWHDVSIKLYENGILIGQGNLTRYPGSPNDQMLNLTHLSVNISRKYSAIVRYTPEDDPVNGQPNGANPCWIILTFDDAEELRLHHNFNVNHPDRYVWEVDLMAAILSHGLTFEATAYDPGADDLTFHWTFGDGTNVTSFYPNMNITYPVQITETITHVFLSSGSFTVTLTVTDDDGGVGVVTINIVIP